MRARSTSKISAYLTQVRELSAAMRTFCLNPSRDRYAAICACPGVRRVDEEAFKVWSSACQLKYGWAECDDPAPRLVSLAQSRPSQGVAIGLIHLFSATGHLQYIDLFYQIMGDSRLTRQTRLFLAQIFDDTRLEYRTEIDRLLRDNPAHFEQLNIDLRQVDFNYFDSVRAVAEEEIAARAEQNKILSIAQ